MRPSGNSGRPDSRQRSASSNGGTEKPRTFENGLHFDVSLGAEVVRLLLGLARRQPNLIMLTAVVACKNEFAIYFRFRKRFEYFSFASGSTARMFLHSQKHSFTRGMRPSENSGRTHARTDAQTAGSVSRAPTAHP